MGIKFKITVNKKIVSADGKPLPEGESADRSEAARKLQEAQEKLAGINPFFFVAIKLLNNFAIVYTVWALFFPLPYRIVILIGVLLPLLAVFAYAYSKGLISFDAPKKSKSLNMASLLIGPPAALAFRSIVDFHLMDYKLIWMPVFCIFVPLALVVWYFGKKYHARKAAYLIAMPFLFLYSFGAAMQANCLLDTSAPEFYHAVVQGKEIIRSSKGGRSYYLKVSHWGDNGPERLDISRRMYDSTNVNDTVRIAVKRGFLGIAHYHVRKNPMS